MDNFGFTPDTQTSTSNFGFTPDASQAPAAPQQPPQSLADSVWNGLAGLGKGFSDATGATAIGQGLGTAAANIGLLAHGKNPNIPVDVPKMAGGVLTAGATIAGAGLPIATAPTAIGRIGQAAVGYGALGGLGSAGSALSSGATPGGVAKSAAIGTAVGAGTGAVGQGIAEGVSALRSPTAQGVSATGQDATDIQAIQDKIAPKVNAKETKLALAQGRIQPGQQPGIFSDGTPDTVLPSAKQSEAAITIKDNIPGASKMSAPELYTAAGNKATEMATTLRPVMDVTPVTPDTVDQITNSWDALKAKQLADPYVPSGVNVEKAQTAFEKLLQGSKSDNMGDLWDTRIKYDASVPANVKTATSVSPDTLQAQKKMWLQNRGILNDAIHNISTGLGETSQKAFKDMSNLYEAQRGIESSYKVAKDGAQGLLRSAFNSPMGKKIQTVAEVGLGLEAGKRILTGQF